jgi:hypothetical protein
MPKEILICFSIMVILNISCEKSEIKKEYQNTDGYKTVGVFHNKKKEGIHISYYSNGNIREIVPYSLDTINGIKVIIYDDSVKCRFNFNKGKLIWQVAIDKYEDTIYSFFKNSQIMKVYYLNNKKPELFAKLSKGKHEKEIRFDSLGNLKVFLNPPLDFITKKDSNDLDKAYPNWKEQIKEWEKMQGGNNSN